MTVHTKDAIEDILEVYKTLPALWKTKSTEYKDRNEKNAQYSILLDTLKKYDPSATQDVLKAKINSLRTSRNKEKRKCMVKCRDGKIQEPKLWYYHLMDFLDSEDIIESSTSSMINEVPALPRISMHITEDGVFEVGRENEVLDADDSDLGTSMCIGHSSRKSSKKLKRPQHGNDDLDIQVLRKIAKKLDRPNELVVGQYWGAQFNEVKDPLQALLAKRLINDVLFEARLGSLTPDHKVGTVLQIEAYGSNST